MPFATILLNGELLLVDSLGGRFAVTLPAGADRRHYLLHAVLQTSCASSRVVLRIPCAGFVLTAGGGKTEAPRQRQQDYDPTLVLLPPAVSSGTCSPLLPGQQPHPATFEISVEWAPSPCSQTERAVTRRLVAAAAAALGGPGCGDQKEERAGAAATRTAAATPPPTRTILRMLAAAPQRLARKPKHRPEGTATQILETTGRLQSMLRAAEPWHSVLATTFSAPAEDDTDHNNHHAPPPPPRASNQHHHHKTSFGKNEEAKMDARRTRRSKESSREGKLMVVCRGLAATPRRPQITTPKTTTTAQQHHRHHHHHKSTFANCLALLFSGPRTLRSNNAAAMHSGLLRVFQRNGKQYFRWKQQFHPAPPRLGGEDLDEHQKTACLFFV